MGILAVSTSLDTSRALIRAAKTAIPTASCAGAEPPAIIEHAQGEHETAVRDAFSALREAEAQEVTAARRAESARDDAARRRLELGKALVRARGAWPASGPRARGWGEFLDREGIEERTAQRYMQLAGYVASTTAEIPDTSAPVSGISVPTYAEAGIAIAPLVTEVARAPNDPHAALHVEPVAMASSAAPAADAAPEIYGPKPDRDGWCTPRDIAIALGAWDVDPCSNARAHIIAETRLRFDLDQAQDGIALAPTFAPTTRSFVNCPYSRGQVIRWIRAYAHTQFCFLLKLDPSTEWFAELYAMTALILIPRGERIEFEPPPGAEASSNQFPHGLFFKRLEDATPEIRALCFEWVIQR